MKTKDQLNEINIKLSKIIELQKETISQLEFISIHVIKTEDVKK
nr:hypothetical protein [uncultured archaeon]